MRGAERVEEGFVLLWFSTVFKISFAAAVTMSAASAATAGTVAAASFVLRTIGIDDDSNEDGGCEVDCSFDSDIDGDGGAEGSSRSDAAAAAFDAIASAAPPADFALDARVSVTFGSDTGLDAETRVGFGGAVDDAVSLDFEGGTVFAFTSAATATGTAGAASETHMGSFAPSSELQTPVVLEEPT